jgi:hypothetical protein
VGSNPIARSVISAGSGSLLDRLAASSFRLGHRGLFAIYAEVAQLVEHATENCGVPSSSLGLGTFRRVGHSGVV